MANGVCWEGSDKSCYHCTSAERGSAHLVALAVDEAHCVKT